MVQIRKKTSNRKTTAHRAKIKHKARETKKKTKKEAKKNPNLHKKKKKKDLGIPNSFPFKEQILTEIATARRQALEEKQRKNELKQPNSDNTLLESTSQPIKLIKESDRNQIHRDDTMEIDDEAPPLMDTTIPDTAAAIQAADVVAYVLDARDPISYRSSFVEKIVGDKPHFFILNKIDLAPRESLKSWLSFLRKSAPTFLFRSASMQMPADALSIKDGKKVQPQDDDAWGLDALMKALRTIKSQKGDLTVTLVGMTNVGKSAIINSIMKKSTLPVYGPLLKHSQNSPSTTPHPRSIVVTQKKQSYRFIDTPGLSFIPPSEARTDEEIETQIARDVLLRNRGNISKITDPLPAALYILSRAVVEDVMMLYNLPAVRADDYNAILTSLARKEGALQKRGAVVDFQGAARALVRDWKTGRLAFYTMPPSEGSNDPTGIPKSSESKLGRMYEETDDQILSQVSPKKELRRSKGAVVQLKGASVDTRRVDLEANVMLSDDEPDDEAIRYSKSVSKNDRMDGSDNDSEGEESETDEGEDEDEDEGEQISLDGQDSDLDEDEDISVMEPSPPPKLSRKKQRDADRAERGHSKSLSSMSTSKKKVSFVPYTKAGAKVKTQAAVSETRSNSKHQSKPEPVQRPKSTSNTKKKSIAADTKTGPTKSIDEGDAYDFSRYF